MTLAFTYIDQVSHAGMRSRPSCAYCARAGSTSDRTHVVGGGFETRPSMWPHIIDNRTHRHSEPNHPSAAGRRKQTLTSPSTDSDRMAQAGIGSTPHHPHRVGTGSTPNRSSPLGAGFRPAITRGVGAGLKPAPTTTPHTAEERLHLCEYATIHTPRGAGNRQ